MVCPSPHHLSRLNTSIKSFYKSNTNWNSALLRVIMEATRKTAIRSNKSRLGIDQTNQSLRSNIQKFGRSVELHQIRRIKGGGRPEKLSPDLIAEMICIRGARCVINAAGQHRALLPFHPLQPLTSTSLSPKSSPQTRLPFTLSRSDH